MRVEITGRVSFRGVVRTSGIVEVPDVTGSHWIATGAAKPVNPPAPAPAPAAERGQKRF